MLRADFMHYMHPGCLATGVRSRLHRILYIALLVCGCTTTPISPNTDHQQETANSTPAIATQRLHAPPAFKARPGYSTIGYKPIQTGRVSDRRLSEISGIVHSSRGPNVLYAVNDGGHPPALYALSEQGDIVARWAINADNRDWEDLSRIAVDGKPWLIVADTGDNLRSHPHARLYFLPQPHLQTGDTKLTPLVTVDFQFEDGPRDIEALSAVEDKLYMISKEPVRNGRRQQSRVYQLNLDSVLPQLIDVEVNGRSIHIESPRLEAQYIASMPLTGGGMLVSMAAVVAKVDLTHPTAMTYDFSTDSIYMLTYGRVFRIRREPGQRWKSAFTQPPTLIYNHRLPQAEALTVDQNGSIWIVSEGVESPVIALISPPSP